MSTIAFLTDFGNDDWYVGTMKGVILGINPHIQLVDIAHNIKAGNIFEGAFALMVSYSYFPKGTVFCVVVDPGVGSGRGVIIAKTSKYTFVGPDNGVLSFATAQCKNVVVHKLTNRKFQLSNTSNTFHGRDIFAPIAAHLSKGVSIKQTGPQIKKYVQLEWKSPDVTGKTITGNIVYIDHFGNAITTIEKKHLKKLQKKTGLFVKAGSKRKIPLYSFYREVKIDSPLALIGSSGFLEVSINGGNAAERLNLKVNDRIQITG